MRLNFGMKRFRLWLNTALPPKSIVLHHRPGHRVLPDFLGLKVRPGSEARREKEAKKANEATQDLEDQRYAYWTISFFR